jgi:2-dehydropantoate 2-reductase
VVQFGPQASLTIGAQDGARTTRVENAYDLLSGAGFDASISDEIIARMWQKWVFIATVGAMTCLMRGTVGEIVAVPGGRDLGPAILAEASAVATAAGYPVPADAIASTTQLVTKAGSPANASLSRDVAEGRPTEVEQVLGDLARRGADHGVKTPLLDLATMQLRVYNNSLGQRR